MVKEPLKKNPHWTALLTVALSVLIVATNLGQKYGQLDNRVDNIEERTENVVTIRELDKFEDSVDKRFDSFEVLLQELLKKN